MLSLPDAALLLVVLLIFLASESYSHFFLKRDGAKVQKYRLFKVRDDLIYLVACGKLRLREDEFVFQTFYKATNHFIKATDSIRISTLVAALKEAREKGLDPAEKEKLEQINKALKNKSEDVAEVVNEFYKAILFILVENSRILQALANLKPLVRLVKSCARWTGKLKPPLQQGVYQFYLDYSRAAHAGA